MTVRSFITFYVKDGMADEFKRVYGDGRVLERAEAIPGFLGGEFLCLDEAAGTFAATVLWDNADSYRAWQDAYATAIPAQISNKLMACLTKFEPGQTYDVLNCHNAS